MSLKKLFTSINTEFILCNRPHTKVKRLLESYNNDDWRKYIFHQKKWLNNPNLDKDNYIRTPIFKDNSDYFDMFIIRFPPSYKTKIHNHDGQDCYFKVLDGLVMENRYLANNYKKKNSLMFCNLLYNKSPTANISHISKEELHSIQNTINKPTYTLNVYSKNNF